MIANEGPTTFVFPVFGDEIKLNMTMSKAPETVVGSDLIKLYFNGLFVGKNARESISDITEYAPREEHSLSEQIWIHEDMVASLFELIATNYFPYEVKEAGITKDILAAFPEIKQYYGADANVHLSLSMENTQGKPINFDKTHGVILGSQSDITSTITILCSNATTKEEAAVVFTANLEAHANITMSNFVVFPAIKQVFAANT